MVTVVPPKVVLMSIRPEYAQKILGGEKRVELRRQRPRLVQGDIVAVYITSPVRELAGAFAVEGVLSLSVASMWRRFGSELGIDRASYKAYFDGCAKAHGITIGRAWASTPLGLDALRRRFDGFVPPQSYMFWPERWILPEAFERMSNAQSKRASGSAGRRVAG